MSKHTPGPWHQCGSSVYGPVADRSGDSDLIAACHTGLRDSEGRQFANAALIAAAPEFLDFVQRFVSDLERAKSSGLKPTWHGWDTKAFEASRLIAKAKGGVQ